MAAAGGGGAAPAVGTGLQVEDRLLIDYENDATHILRERIVLAIVNETNIIVCTMLEVVQRLNFADLILGDSIDVRQRLLDRDGLDRL